MAAETITAARAATTFPAFQASGSGLLQVAWGTTTIAAGNLLEADDVVKLCKVPAGATVIGGYLQAADLDTGTEALDFDIGWAANGVDAADPDGFGNLGTLSGDAVTDIKPEAGLFYPLGGVLFTAGPKQFLAETTIELDVNTAANATGTGQITVVVFYTHDGQAL